MRAILASAVVLVGTSVVSTSIAWGEERAVSDYPLEYPAADEFCAPVGGFFAEAERTFDRVGTHTFRHQPNGGYGLPVQDMAHGKHLLHLGADVGWYRIGEPVCAIANGVVRVSEGRPKQAEEKTSAKRGKAKLPAKLAWGNVVAVEHRLADGLYVTSIYGHLDDDRQVKVGDVVKAGQMLGKIGNTRMNGGYKPHLHLGLREGRMAEVGRKLVLMSPEGTGRLLTIAEVRDKSVVLTSTQELPDRITAGVDGSSFELTKRDGKAEVAAALLRYLVSPEFAIVGYGLSTDGWMDPTAFLAAHGAEVMQAVQGSQKQATKRRTTRAVRGKESGVGEDRK
jgi:murein DD-endopeptidase MepM/ murein hydrolase activator NlpD